MKGPQMARMFELPDRALLLSMEPEDCAGRKAGTQTIRVACVLGSTRPGRARKERARLSRLQGLAAKLPQTLAAGAKNVDDFQGRVMTLQEAVSILNLVVVAGTGGV